MKVQILMSTYNGEKYISEQLNSLLQQRDVDIDILVRDDGSTDKTLDILADYSKKYKNVNYYTGENLRSAKSFMDLVVNSGDFDYYGFCDQDDIWDNNKVISSVNILQKADNSKPNCCFSNFRLCDVDGNYIGDSSISNDIKFDFFNIMAINPVPGCTMLFNSKVKQLICDYGVPENMRMHDCWVVLLCSVLGGLYFDSKPRMSYRQHSGNVVGMPTSFTEKIKFKLSLLKRKKNSPFSRELKDFLDKYREIIPGDKLKYVVLLSNCNDGFFKRLKVVFTFKIRSYSIKQTLMFRLMVLFGAR